MRRHALLESLENRQLLAGPDLIGVQPNQDSLLFESPVLPTAPSQRLDVLSASPRELVFRFDDDAELDPDTLSAIRITRAGEDKAFESATATWDLGTGGSVLLEFRAAQGGTVGNGITVTFTASARASATPGVSVDGRDVTIDVSDHPSRPTTAQGIITAIENEPAARSLVEAIQVSGPSQGVVGTSVPSGSVLTLQGANAAQAVTDFGTGGAARVRLVSQIPGESGRETRVEVEQRNFGGSANPVVVVTGQNVLVQLNSSPGNETTVGQFISAINNNPDAAEVIRASLEEGSLETRIGGQPTNYSPLSLTGVSDVEVVPGFVGLGDSAREVVFRFAEPLPDDIYQIDVLGTGPNVLANVDGEAFRDGENLSRRFRIDLPPQVVAVVPEPVRRNADGTLAPATGIVEVYFNDDDLDPAAAENPGFYPLIFTRDSATNADDFTVLPASVDYNPLANMATLDFGRPLSRIPDPVNGGFLSGAARLRVGSGEALPAAPTPIDVSASEPGDSFGTAFDLDADWTTSGATTRSARLTSEITNETPFELRLPGPDLPGTRNIRPEDPSRLLRTVPLDHLRNAADSVDGISTIQYNFRPSWLGDDPNRPGIAEDKTYFNLISEQQKDRVREALHLFSEYLGVNFVEVEGAPTSSAFVSIAVGDLYGGDERATSGPGGLAVVTRDTTGSGVPDLAVLDFQDFDDSTGGEFGGVFFRGAMFAIGQLLGFGFADDLPQPVTQSTDFIFSPGAENEPSFPSVADIVHGQHLYRPDSTDVDLYRFTLSSPGTLSVETIAERLGSASLLDTALRLYRADADGEFQEVAFNDDYFSRDSLLRLEVEAGTYVVGVSSTGNTAYDPEIGGTGFGGRTQGSYELRLDFRPDAVPSLRDTSGNALDGDGDGQPGGVFDFWFVPSDPNNTLYVDKVIGGSGSGPLGSIVNPYREIDQAIAAAGAGDTIRVLGNGGVDGRVETAEDNFSYQIGFRSNGTELPDGGSLDLPRGVRLVIDAAAVLKFNRSRVGVGSVSPLVDVSDSALQVLGTPVLVGANGLPIRDGGGQIVPGGVTFTSINDDTVGTGNQSGSTPNPRAGDWGGIDFRGDLDFADEERRNRELEGVFLNHVQFADLRYGGGAVSIAGQPIVVSPIEMAVMRPTVMHSRVTDSANAAMAATPDSFAETRFTSPTYQANGAFTPDYDRVGPHLVGNTVIDNSINGLFVRVSTRSGERLQELTTSARFDDVDIPHVLSENLVIAGNPGGPLLVSSAPSSLLIRTAPTVSGNVPAGSYAYRLTNVGPSGTESVASQPTTPVTLNSTGGVQLNQLPTVSGGSGFVSRRLYRAAIDPATGQPGEFRLVAQLNASSTSYVDRAAAGTTPLDDGATTLRSRLDASLKIDAGAVIKLDEARIEGRFGGNLIAEGTADAPVVFTSVNDNRYGGAGTFDTTGTGDAESAGGDWGGIYVGQGSSASIDRAVISGAGGTTRIEGGTASFNPIEVHQGDLRLANSRFEGNADGVGDDGGSRVGRGENAAGTVFVRAAAPVIVNNEFFDGEGPVITVDLNSLSADEVNDPGRSSGSIRRFDVVGNTGPLVQGNVLDNNSINGMQVRGGQLATSGVWDDVDIVHVVNDTIEIPNRHIFGGLRLQSDARGSLVVKFEDSETDPAGIVVGGSRLSAADQFRDIPDRIGGSMQVVGHADFPVIMTTLADDSSGAGFDRDGSAQVDTNNDGFVFDTSESGAGRLPTGPEVNRGTTIDNDVDVNLPGYFEATIGGGNEVNQSLVTIEDLANDQVLTNQDYIFLYTTYVIVGGTGTRLSQTTITQAPTLIADDVVQSRGTFTGPNGDVEWTAESRFEDGIPTLFSSVSFAATGGGALGDIRVVSYLDEDVGAISDDILVTTGTPGEADFRAYTLDGPTRVGFSHGGFYTNDGVNQENAVYAGWTADQFPALDAAVAAGTATYSVPGDINLANLPAAPDADFGTRWGPADVTTAFAWDVDAASSTAQVTSFLELLAADPAEVNPFAEIPSGQWEGIMVREAANDRNVAAVFESEPTRTSVRDTNSVPSRSQFLGELAPDEQSGDENRRLGFVVNGVVSTKDDVDVYSFVAESGTEVWLDIDRTSQHLDTVLELVNANGQVLALSNDSLRAGQGFAQEPFSNVARGMDEGAAQPLSVTSGGAQQDAYSTNPKDAGMRVVLPGESGTRNLYHVRVRSSSVDRPTAGDRAALQELIDNVRGGLTTGRYELQVRLREQDEVAGTQMNLSEVRYATNGLRIIGQPLRSPLLGEDYEKTGDNDSLADAQPLGIYGAAEDEANGAGGPLQSDRLAKSFAGQLDSADDVDWYQFEVRYDNLTRDDADLFLSTMFDLDYADNFARSDMALYVFDADGRLVLIGGDSNIADDQPGNPDSNDTTDLSRGSAGTNDPFIGPAELSEGTYFVAVSNAERVPAPMDQFFNAGSSNPLLRLEPADSVRRIAEDRIGSSGGGTASAPVLPLLFDNDSYVEHTLDDVLLYVNTANSLAVVNPFTGHVYGTVGDFGDEIRDMAFRANGELFAYTGFGDRAIADDAWSYRRIDTETGQLSGSLSDGAEIETFHWSGDFDDDGVPVDRLDSDDGLRVEAITIREFGGQETGFFVGNRPVNRLGVTRTDNLLYAFDDETGVATGPNFDPTGGQLPNMGAATSRREVGEIDTTPLGTNRQLGVGPATRVSGSGAIVPRFFDGDTFTIGSGANVVTFELDSGVTLSADTGTNVTDGDAVRIDGVTFEFDQDGALDDATAVAVPIPAGQVGGESAIRRLAAAARGEGIAVADAGITMTLPNAASVTVVSGSGLRRSGSAGVDAGNTRILLLPNDTAGTLARRIVDAINQAAALPPGASGALPDVSARLGGQSGHSVEITGVGQILATDGAFVAGGAGTGGLVTGAELVDTSGNGTNDALFAVTNTGGLYRVSAGELGGTGNRPIGQYVATATDLIGLNFTSLRAGPPDILDGELSQTLFGTTASGVIYAFNTSGELLPVFAGGRSSIATGVSGVLGLDFATVNSNLWHVTDTRGDDDGHGIDPLFNGTRDRVEGGSSLAFNYEADAFADRYPTAAEQPARFDGAGNLVNPRQDGATLENSINVPGGARGAIQSNRFSLEGYAAGDQPALYFNYFLEGEPDSDEPDDARDTLRVYVVTEDGREHLVASSSTARDPGLADDEFDVPTSAGVFGDVDVDVQQLFNATGTWRQARVPLGEFAGQQGLGLRIEFATAGTTDTGPRTDHLRAVAGDRLVEGQQLVVGGETFEIDLLPTLSLPSGSEVASVYDADADAVAVVTIDGQEYVLDDGTRTIGPDQIAVDLATLFPGILLEDLSSAQIGSAVADTLEVSPPPGEEITGVNFSDLSDDPAIDGDRNDLIYEATALPYSGGSATLIGGGRFGSVDAVGNPTNLDDVDLQRLDVVAGTTLSVRASMVSNPNVRPVVRFFDASGESVGASFDSATDTYRFTSPADGAVYVGLSGTGNDRYDPRRPGSAGPGIIGEYTAEIEIDVPVSNRRDGGLLEFESPIEIGASPEGLFEVRGQSEPQGIPVRVSRFMSATEVAESVQRAIADRFAGGRLGAVPVAGSAIRLGRLPVQDAGPFGDPGERWGDRFGAGVIEGTRNNEFEGVYLDDFIIGFAERGEIATGSDIVSDPFVLDERPQFPLPEDPTSDLVTGAYQVEIRDGSEYVDSLAGSPFRTFDTNDRLDEAVRLTASAGDELRDGATFTITDGPSTFTFEFDQVELDNGVAPGNVPVPFSLRVADPVTGLLRPNTAAEVAANIVDAINRPDVGPLIGASALPTSGVDGRGDPSINLFGDVLVDDVDGVLAAVDRGERRGDSNRERSGQGMILVENSRFLFNAEYGIDISHDVNVSVDGVETPSAVRYPRNLVTLNSENLKPGVVIRSNVIGFNEAGGLQIAGIDPAANETGGDPVGYDRIVNNTIIGGAVAPGVSSPSQTYQGILFESGAISFADAVASYDPGAGGNPPAAEHRDAENAIGVPDGNGRGPEPADPETTVSLGSGGSLTLQFVDNLLTGSGDSRADLIVFETGDVESVRVEVSRDGTSFIDVGIVGGQTNTVDLDAFGFGVQDRFAFVRLTDLRQGSTGVASRGADIDAVGALSTVPVERFRPGGVGINVLGNAAPAVLNNVIANSDEGVNAAAAGTLSIYGGNSFYRNTADVAGNASLGEFAQLLSDSEAVFVSPSRLSFVPASGSRIIDSSIDSLEDRPSLNAVKNPLGLPPSPILAPRVDVNGQLRVDDPDVDSPSGLGEQVFKDRGAADRGDQVGPRVMLLSPQAPELGEDSGTVSVFGQPPAAFELQLIDGLAPADVVPGTGIDDSSVSSDSVLLLKDGVPLVEGVDYRFGYNPSTNVIRLTPIAGVWETDATYAIRMVDASDAILAASEGVTYVDGTRFRVLDSQGQSTTFEYETGIVLTLDASLAGTDAADGIVLEVFDGVTSRTFELDNDGALNPANIAVAIPEDPTMAQLTGALVDAINGSGGLSLTAVAADNRVQLSGGTPLATVTSSRVTVAVDGEFGTLVGFGIRVPADGSEPAAGVAEDGQTFTVRRGTATEVTFEFDTNGSVRTEGAVSVSIPNNATLDQIADAIVRAVAGTTLGLVPDDAGFGRVFLGGGTNLSFDAGDSGLTQIGAPGDAASVPVPVRIDQTAAEVAEAIADSIATAGLPGVDASVVDRRVFLSGTGGVSGTGAVEFAVIRDEVGNELQSNRPDGRTELTIFLGGGFDYGDAPAPYVSLLEEGGPRHRVDPDFSLGATVTPDADAKLPDADEDDGVRVIGDVRAGFTSNVEIIVNNADSRVFFVDAWFDWNDNGAFEPNEVLRFGSPGTGRIPLQNGTNVVAVNVPAATDPGEIYARFRLSEDSNLGPLGDADSGEVEDHRLVVSGNPFQNPVSRFDVNDSGVVTPLDALQIINALDGQMTIFLDNPPLPPLPAFPDVNGDSRVTALDALLVINELARQFSGSSGEGEASGQPDGSVGGTYAVVGNGVLASSETLAGDAVIAASGPVSGPATDSASEERSSEPADLPAISDDDSQEQKLSVFDHASVIEIDPIVDELAADTSSAREADDDPTSIRDRLFAGL